MVFAARTRYPLPTNDPAAGIPAYSVCQKPHRLPNKITLENKQKQLLVALIESHFDERPDGV